MLELDQFHWAGKVSRRDIQRLYESDEQGRLDEELLEKVLFKVHTRICDMFEVREAQKLGKVKCRNCGTFISQPLYYGGAYREVALVCPKCGWETNCGEYIASYSGKDLLPGSRTNLFEEFMQRFAKACTPQEKMLLLDWLIHEFHYQSGVSSRLVAMNVIQGSRNQLVEMLTSLAANDSNKEIKDTFMSKADDPIRRFRSQYPSHKKVLDIAAQLGIRGRTKMPENELILEILRRQAK